MTLDALARLFTTELNSVRLVTAAGITYDITSPDQIVNRERRRGPEDNRDPEALPVPPEPTSADFEDLLEFITFAKNQVARRAATKRNNET